MAKQRYVPPHDAVPTEHAAAHHGRGTALNPTGRFERLVLTPDQEAEPDPDPEAAPMAPRTVLLEDDTKTIITRHDSPDIPFEYSLNPYRGCEHGCIYCYARPYHEYLGMSAGLDFETKILVKRNAPALLRAELSKRNYRPSPLIMSGVTDPYQPVERHLKITRQCLEVLLEFRHPVSLITKNALILRDLPILAELARFDCASVLISTTSLDEKVRLLMEPRTSVPQRRLDAIRELNAAGVPTGVMVGPIVPGLTDHEVPAIIAAAGEAGARFLAHTVLRLPYGVAALVDDWLARHFPNRRDKVMNQVREVHGGKLNDSRWGLRMRGDGPFAEPIHFMVRAAKEKAGIGSFPGLTTEHFRVPGTLFDSMEAFGGGQRNREAAAAL
jgi:DNA repair photolyase